MPTIPDFFCHVCGETFRDIDYARAAPGDLACEVCLESVRTLDDRHAACFCTLLDYGGEGNTEWPGRWYLQGTNGAMGSYTLAASRNDELATALQDAIQRAQGIRP